MSNTRYETKLDFRVWYRLTSVNSRRLQDTKNDRKDFIHYILKQGEQYDLSQDEVIVNAALFM